MEEENEAILDRGKGLSQAQRHDCEACLLVDLLDGSRGDYVRKAGWDQMSAHSSSFPPSGRRKRLLLGLSVPLGKHLTLNPDNLLQRAIYDSYCHVIILLYLKHCPQSDPPQTLGSPFLTLYMLPYYSSFYLTTEQLFCT